MKRVMVIVILFTYFQMLTSCKTAQRVYVLERPISPVIVRPMAPIPSHIWLEPEWVWRDGRYEFVNGYWVAPKVSRRYVPGYWKHSKRGEYWIGGGWSI
jgi:hypothetical protein